MNNSTQTPLDQLLKVFGIGSALLMVVSAAALGVMMLVISGDVVLRNLLGVSVTGVAEVVSQWLMPTTVLFALAYTERRSEHIRVTVVEESMHGVPRRAIAGLGQVFAVVIGLVMACGSIELAMHSWAIRESVPMGTGQLSIWPVKVAIVPAWVWLVLQGIATLLGNIFPSLRGAERSRKASQDDTLIEGGINA